MFGSGEVWNSHDRLLRQHRKETFINKWRLVTVLIPSNATEQLVTIERWLSEVFESLFGFIIKGKGCQLKFADRLGHAGVNMLLDFLKGNDHHRNKKIQPLHIHPLFLRKGCLASSSVATRWLLGFNKIFDLL
ncbi:hypothetical protein OROMI_008931 [Orobanche minor]